MEMRETPSFAPVVITLTSEEEVTQLYAVLNYTSIFDVLDSGICRDWNKLRTFLSDRRGDYTPWHNKLRERFKKVKGV